MTNVITYIIIISFLMFVNILQVKINVKLRFIQINRELFVSSIIMC